MPICPFVDAWGNVGDEGGRCISAYSRKINGIVGKYEVPSNHQLAPNTSYGSNVYSLKITSMPETGFWFRIGVSGGVIRCSLKSMVISLR